MISEVDDSTRNSINLSQKIVEDADIENEFQVQNLNDAYQKYYDTLVGIVLGNFEQPDQSDEILDYNDDELLEVRF